MKHTIMVSYDGFTPGLHSAVEMITGKHNDILSTNLEVDMSADEFAANFRTLVGPLNTDDSVILLADILNGSPFTNALTVLNEEGLMSNTLVFAGMSMSLAITVVLMKDSFDDTELLRETLLSEGYVGFTEFEIESDGAEDDI